MAFPFTDGNILVNSFTANINSVIHVVNNATLEYPAESIVITDENNNPTAARHFKGDLARGTAQIQVNSSAQQGDIRGETFSTDQFTGASQNFTITTQSMPVEKGSARVYEIGFVEVLN